MFAVASEYVDGSNAVNADGKHGSGCQRKCHLWPFRRLRSVNYFFTLLHTLTPFCVCFWRNVGGQYHQQIDQSPVIFICENHRYILKYILQIIVWNIWCCSSAIQWVTLSLWRNRQWSSKQMTQKGKPTEGKFPGFLFKCHPNHHQCHHPHHKMVKCLLHGITS